MQVLDTTREISCNQVYYVFVCIFEVDGEMLSDYC